MASVPLSELWVHEADNLANYVTTDGFAQENESRSVPGRVQTYAGGRRRTVTRPGSATSLQTTFPVCARVTVAWLRSLAGTTVLLRDPYGRVEWGVYLSVDVSERGSGIDPDVSFTLESVTGSAAV